jgi:hypothetical protein
MNFDTEETKMRKSNWQVMLTASAMLLAGSAYAQDEEVVVGDDPEQILEALVLPDEASDTARIHAEHGLETANAARADGRAFGEAMAEGRGEIGREIAAAARESAQAVAEQARENATSAAAEARENAADIADSMRQRGLDMRPEVGGQP